MKSEGLRNSVSLHDTAPSTVESVDETSLPSGPDTRTTTSSPRVVPHAPAKAEYSEGFFPPPRFNELPSDILGRVFDLLATDPDFSRALTRLAQTSKDFNRLIVNFVNSYSGSAGPGVATPLQAQMWKARAEFIKENAGQLREDFEASQQIVSDLVAARSGSAKEISTADVAQFDSLTGVEFRLQDSSLEPAVLASLLSKLEHKVIRLDAKGIGRERFLNEVIPALKSVNPGCQLVLDASDNQLSSDDLKPVLDYMATSPRIYRLDLSGNPLCSGDGPAAEVLQLFKFAGPMTDLCLNGTGLNDATAVGLKQTLADATALTKLYLQGNRLTEDGAIAIMQAIAPGSDPDHRVLTSIRRVQLTDNDYELTDGLRSVSEQVYEHLWKAFRNVPDIKGQRFEYLAPLYLLGQKAVFELGKSQADRARLSTSELGLQAIYYSLDEEEKV